MIAPVILKTAIAVGAIGEIATIVAAAQIGEGNTVLLVSAMTSFVAFIGVVVTGFVTYSGQKSAERERIAMAKEARETATKVIETVEAGNAVIGKVEVSTNSAASELKAELKASREATKIAVAAMAEMTKRYELLVAEVARRPGNVAAPDATTPTPVVVVDTAKPVEVDVVTKKPEP